MSPVPPSGLPRRTSSSHALSARQVRGCSHNMKRRAMAATARSGKWNSARGWRPLGPIAARAE
eukprot:4956974-Pyramimonas_sp.AAC.1